MCRIEQKKAKLYAEYNSTQAITSAFFYTCLFWEHKLNDSLNSSNMNLVSLKKAKKYHQSEFLNLMLRGQELSVPVIHKLKFH